MAKESAPIDLTSLHRAGSSGPSALIQRRAFTISDRPAAQRRRVIYLMLFRLVLISLVLGATVLTSWLSDVDLAAPNSLVLLGIIATTYMLTIVYALALRRDTAPERLADIQLSADLITSTLLVHVTGGAQSAYTFFFPLSIIAAAAIRFRIGAVIVAAASIGLFSTISVLGWLDVVPSLAGQRVLPSALSSVQLGRALALNLAAFAGVAVLAYNLGGQIQQTTASLETQRTATADLKAVHEDIIRSLSSGLITVDSSGTILTINRVACEILAVAQRTVVGTDIDQLMPGFDELVAELPERDILRGADLAVLCGDERELNLGITVSPLRNNRDQVLGRIINFQDLTEHRKMEQQMRQAERLAVVGTLAAGVAHEIRNPLAAMSGSIELLHADPRTDDDSRALMDIVIREVERLNTLITELLDYTNPHPRELLAFDLSGLAEETVTMFEQDRAFESIAVKMASDSMSDPLEIVADPGRIRQVLWNLLRNGAQAAESRVEVCIADRDEQVRIEVRDDGPGIAEEHLERIFDPFFTTKNEGSGLGLATCANIILEQGGTIGVENRPDGGCCFWVSLPRDCSEFVKLPRRSLPSEKDR